jgi:hypothetical protein
VTAVLPEPTAQPDIAARRAALFPTILRPSRKRLLRYLATSVVFVAIGVWMRGQGGNTWGVPNSWDGGAVIAFFGFGVAIFAVMLLPGAAYLKIDEAGFTVCSLFRPRFTPWEAVEGFGVTEIVVRKFVGVVLMPAGRQAARMGRLNNRLVGFDDALPDTYGRSAEEMAALMNDALALAPTARRPSAG